MDGEDSLPRDEDGELTDEGVIAFLRILRDDMSNGLGLRRRDDLSMIIGSLIYHLEVDE